MWKSLGAIFRRNIEGTLENETKNCGNTSERKREADQNPRAHTWKLPASEPRTDLRGVASTDLPTGAALVTPHFPEIFFRVHSIFVVLINNYSVPRHFGRVECTCPGFPADETRANAITEAFSIFSLACAARFSARFGTAFPWSVWGLGFRF